MSTTDTIRQMRSQGYNDPDIINSLQQQGISPREINDSLNQSRIKQAVSDNSDYLQGPQSTQEIEGMGEMQPSLINQPQEMNQNYEDYSQGYGTQVQPMTQEYQDQYSEQYPQQDQQYGYPEDYQNYGYAQNNDLTTELINQITGEKLEKVNKTISSLVEFKSLLTNKVEKIDERLKEIEAIINQLQMSLIRKSNEQEQNISDIKSEMKHMQTSFGKIINPLTDSIREFEEIAEKHSKPKKKSSSKKRK
jgi:phage host-nuclease inhibitor protein Gam